MCRVHVIYILLQDVRVYYTSRRFSSNEQIKFIVQTCNARLAYMMATKH